jgi:predicted nucleic acid-binding protein
MILLINVPSELMRPGPNENVIQWMDALPDDDIYSAVTVAEIRLGLAFPRDAASKY